MTNKEILIFAQLFFVAAVGGALIRRPLNVATSVGSQTIFNCSSDTTGAITWLYTTNCNTAGGSTLTDSSCNIISSYSSHYRTEKPDGFVCNLIIFDALLSLGGCYACADGFGTGRLFQAMLIVVDSNANITTNSTDIIPGEDVLISSSVSYRGPSLPQQPPPLPPSFYWTLQSDPSQNITSYQGSTTNTTASSHIISKAQPPNVSPFLCNLFFHAPAVVPASCADNAPTYSRSWTTPTYPVSYPPHNVTISGTPNPCLHEPVQLTCSASGYPTPTYKWFVLTNGGVLPGSNPVTIDRGGSYQCVASNKIKNVPYNASQTVNVSDCEPPQNVNITASSGPCADSCGSLSSDTLTCIASGFPEPEYEWSFSGEEVIGPTVVAKKNIAYQCTATNYYGDQPHSASTTLQVDWLTVASGVELGICGPECICLLNIAIYFGIYLMFFTIFMIRYGCSKNGRNTLNDRFPWRKKMLPCVNDEGYRQLNEKYRNERGGRGTQVKTLGTATYQYPSRMTVTSNPPSSLDTSAHFQPDQTDKPYPHSSTQQRQPTYLGNSDPYPPNPRNLQLPRKTPSPALSSGAIVYGELGVDNQPKSRRPIQPIQNDANTYADIAMA